MIYYLRYGTYARTDPQDRSVVASIKMIAGLTNMTAAQVKYGLQIFEKERFGGGDQGRQAKVAQVTRAQLEAEVT